MRHRSPRRARRPIIIIVCSILRVERRVRATCGPIVRNVARVVVRVLAGEGDDAAMVATHIIVAAASTAAFGAVAAWAGFGSSELCKIASALVVGALAAGAASTLIQRRLHGPQRKELRALLVSTTRQLLAENPSLPAARVLRVVLQPQKSAARASLGVAVAALAPALDSAAQATLLRFALRPATRLLPGMGVVLDFHDACLDLRDNARFVREFALTAAALCPEPAALPALCA